MCDAVAIEARMRCLIPTASIVLLLLSSASAAKPTFIHTWKAPGAANVGYAGKKIVGLVVSNDMSLRMSSEEALARELTAKGVEGIAAYRVIPAQEIRDANTVRSWFERAGAAGVVVMRLIDLAKETMPSVMVWQSAPYYGSLWSYYPYVWGATFDITPARTEVKIVVETLVFDVAGNQLLWAGTSESTNPESAQTLIKSIVDGAADRMKKDGLMRRK
jgi:hypothetical protein